MQATYALIPDERIAELHHEELSPADLDALNILVETEATVISPGTELSIFTASVPGVRIPGRWNSYPCRPGYGAVGRVLATGDAVRNVRVGQRIFFYGHHASHEIYTLEGKKSAYTISEDISAVNAVMLRMAIIALTAPILTQIEIGTTVAVFGLGIVGNIAAQLYRMRGAHVIGIDPVQSRCDLAKKVGIPEAYAVQPEEQVAFIKEWTSGKGAEVTVDAVGHSAVIESCVSACADMGQVILLGSPRTAYEGDLTPAYRQIHLRWLTMRGALELPLAPHPELGIRHSIQSDIDRLTAAIQRGQLRLEELVSHIIAPQQLQTAYEGLLNNKEQYTGVVIDWRT